ncbi:MAG: hypothetical protein M1818_000864 [Claussenomyces sp. TS43310]|nr:MAG: hypothetical protein M1818_000864 [Claussenomyces sp. TS43310]
MSLAPSSPRLPSPPPPTEIQIGPQSPSSSNSHDRSIEQGTLDAISVRRIHPGTKAADMAGGPPLVALMELDSAFQLQEHLKALHYHHTKPQSNAHTISITRKTASIIATPPDGVDRALWLYELCRFLINKCNDLIVGFLFDSPPCSSSTCPEMRASEWQFLCAVHESPKSCCAIDYCCHTLDWATNIVTSQKIFPSRLSLGAGDAVDDRGAGIKHLVNIFRRLHRIFAHAWFQHRGVFWQVEGQTGLYVLFKTVCDSYELLPAENYKLPPEAEGLEPVHETKVLPMILKSDIKAATETASLDQEDPSFISVGRTNTRRHIRSSPSTGSAVTTVHEAEEDESHISRETESTEITETEVISKEEASGNEPDTARKEDAAKIIIAAGPTQDDRNPDEPSSKKKASPTIECIGTESSVPPVQDLVATTSADVDVESESSAVEEGMANAPESQPNENSLDNSAPGG